MRKWLSVMMILGLLIGMLSPAALAEGADPADAAVLAEELDGELFEEYEEEEVPEEVEEFTLGDPAYAEIVEADDLDAEDADDPDAEDADDPDAEDADDLDAEDLPEGLEYGEEMTYSEEAAYGEVASGDCGTTVTWSLDDQGVLTISGTGAITSAGWNTDALRGSIKSVVIESGVTSICERAFSECTNLESATLPEGIEMIDYFVFSDCTSLESFTIPNSVTRIRKGAFGGCTALESLYFPDNVSSIDYSAFPITISYLYASKDSESARQISWKGFSFREPGSNCSYKYYIISGSEQTGLALTSVDKDVVEFDVPNDVTKIDMAFDGCSDLTSVTIPEGVTELYYAFRDCSSLATLTLPTSLTTIGDYSFSNCTGLTTLSIPNGVTTIGNSAFIDCANLAELTLPASLTTVGQYAFYGCDELDHIIWPDNVTSVGRSVRSSETKFYANVKSKTAKALGQCKYSFYTMDGVFSIIPYLDGGMVLFQIITEADSASVPDGVTSIGTYPNKVYIPKSIKSLTLPESVTYIDGYAFSHLENLTSILIPASVTEIGDGAFLHSDNVTILTPCQAYARQYAIDNGVSCQPAHDWGEATYEWAADNASVTATHTCTLDNEVETETVATTAEITKEATCSEKGDTTYSAVFTKDGFTAQSKTVEDIDAHHTWKTPAYDWSDDFGQVTATCDCALCEFVANETVKTTSKVTKTQTCTEKGETTYTATFTSTAFAAQTKTVENILANGHMPVAVKGKAATCTATGLTDGEKCSVCNTWIAPQQTIAKRAHTPVTVKGYAATCAKAGLTDGTKCSVCNTWITPQKSIPATGKHSFGAWKTTKAATCTATGTQSRSCSVCNKVETQTLAKVAHKPTTVKGYVATYVKTGLSDGTKCSVCGTWITRQTTIAQKVYPGSVLGKKGKNGTITAYIGTPFYLTPQFATNAGVAVKGYKSSKKGVATVHASSGLVVPQKEGKATITVTTKNKKVKATITVKVVDPYKPTGISITNGKTVTMKVGQTLKLGTALQPANARTTLTWKSSKKKVASVNKITGEVKALKKGTAKITVTTKNKKKTTITIKVEP